MEELLAIVECQQKVGANIISFKQATEKQNGEVRVWAAEESLQHGSVVAKWTAELRRRTDWEAAGEVEASTHIPKHLHFLTSSLIIVCPFS